jgi:serine/threonine-protein kinase RsbW
VGIVTTIRLEFPTDLGSLAALEHQTAALLANAPPLEEGDIVRYNIWLAVHELCVNIIKHAYGGQPGRFIVTMTLADDPWRVQVVSEDHGPHQYDLANWVQPDLDDLPVHGLGIFLIRQLMDDVDYTPGPYVTRWRLMKLLPVVVPV